MALSANSRACMRATYLKLCVACVTCRVRSSTSLALVPGPARAGAWRMPHGNAPCAMGMGLVTRERDPNTLVRISWELNATPSPQSCRRCRIGTSTRFRRSARRCWPTVWPPCQDLLRRRPFPLRQGRQCWSIAPGILPGGSGRTPHGTTSADRRACGRAGQSDLSASWLV